MLAPVGILGWVKAVRTGDCSVTVVALAASAVHVQPRGTCAVFPGTSLNFVWGLCSSSKKGIHRDWGFRANTESSLPIWNVCFVCVMVAAGKGAECHYAVLTLGIKALQAHRQGEVGCGKNVLVWLNLQSLDHDSCKLGWWTWLSHYQMSLCYYSLGDNGMQVMWKDSYLLTLELCDGMMLIVKIGCPFSQDNWINAAYSHFRKFAWSVLAIILNLGITSSGFQNKTGCEIATVNVRNL